MINIEKIIKGIESCLSPHDPNCDLCPYDSIDLRCRAKLRNDVMTLLKEQEPVKAVRRVEETEWNVCSNCGSHIISKWKWCPYCGRAVKWDG